MIGWVLDAYPKAHEEDAKYLRRRGMFGGRVSHRTWSLCGREGRPLEFTTVRNDIEVRCRIVSSYGEITTRLMMGGQELAMFELRDAEKIRVVVNKRREVLVATFAPKLRLDNFALQLKPRVGAAWGNLHQFP